MPGIELVALRTALGEGLPIAPAPSCVETREGDRVARIDGEDGLEITREVAVQRSALERDLVVRHQARRSARPG
jgi:hypothetical protein